MSAVAGPGRLADRPRLPRARRLAVPVRVHPDAGLTVGLAFVLCALAFYARGGVANGPNTYAEVLLVAGAAVLGALAIAGPSRHARLTRFHGATALAGFALLALLTGLSILWSLDPSASWLETNRTLAYPALGLVLVCLMLAYSRGALLALAIGLIAWFAVVPLRLRGAVALLVPAAAAAVVVAWAFGQDGLTEDRLANAVRADAGAELGLMLVLMVLVLLAAGLAIGFATATRAPSPRTRVWAGRIVIGALGVALLGGGAGLASASGGIDGQVSTAWRQMTDPDARPPATTPNRLTATASVRARYWREAFKIHAESKAVGIGAGAYGLGRKRFRTSNLDVQHAHGYAVQTLADLGYVGLGVSLLAALAWIVAALRATGLTGRRRDRGLPWDAERVGLATLAVVVLIFGVHSLIDWTWFVPANAVLAFVCAGWVAGRGPLRERLEQEGPTGAIPAAERAGHLVPGPRFTVRDRLVRWRPAPYRTGVAAAVLVLAAIVLWTTVQPLRAQHAGDAVTARLAAGEPAAAVDIAERGARRNPLSPEPLWELSAARAAAGDRAGAERALDRAVELQPSSAEAWRRLGRFRLDVLNDPEGALDAFRPALYLDPESAYSQSDVIEATRARLAAGLVAPTATTPLPPASPLPDPGLVAGRAGDERRVGRGDTLRRQPGRLERPRQRPCREEPHVLAHRVEVLVEAQERDRRPPQPRVGGRGEQQPAARGQHPADVLEEAERVGDVLDRLAAPDELDLAVGKRQRPVRVVEPPQLGTGGVGACPLQRGGRHVDADAARREGQEAPGAAAQVQPARARAQRRERLRQQAGAPTPPPRLGVGRSVAPRLVEHPRPHGRRA